MFLIPMNQVESVDLVIHALRMAGGEADCTDCPVRKVCMKQCLAVAEGVQRLVESNSLPRMDLGGGHQESPSDSPVQGGEGSHLRIIK
jgi:hypothetical protein